ncbi:MAG: cysteine peptidase family C39 domain-containing protein [Mariniblastus sp.]|nr:cysteine peptidase family C39 domain-containing protein [Mariniblastus sp.]
MQRNYLSLSLFFIPPLLLLAALDFEGGPIDAIRLHDIPFELNEPGFSGEACLSMFLKSHGHDISQDRVFSVSGLDPIEGRGCRIDDLAKAAEKLGMDSRVVKHFFRASSRQANMKKIWRDALADLQHQHASIFHISERGTRSFVLVSGYDPESDQVIFHDPEDSKGRYRRLDRSSFLRRCITKVSEQQLSLERLPLSPVMILNDSVKRIAFTDAEFAQHISALKQKLPPGDFHIVIEKPFVVIGDESLNEIHQRAKTTIKWAVDRLKQQYFAEDPNEIIDIWLFKNRKSYERNVPWLVGYEPTTPFGFYSSQHHVLVMNISTGGGTLVHEIVHPFMERNFPQCPSWFNEGLASLYEQCRDQSGHIRGSTNWRLRGLQGAIQSNRVPSFKDLCETTREQFYREDPGTNYSQARYLCYYLQEQGLLKKYYEAFRSSVAHDPTGYQTLQEILGTSSMDQFQREWEAFVMGLRFQN